MNEENYQASLNLRGLKLSKEESDCLSANRFCLLERTGLAEQDVEELRNYEAQRAKIPATSVNEGQVDLTVDNLHVSRMDTYVYRAKFRFGRPTQ
ncbi:hypothetical protein [Chryseolinea sp. H1M3-3]|uniref:hypothetical protein n=1 Tax=Chryseolinea sp. H1M3-3 TaxID=3034144 RepID=UPI0023EC632A|nr:hypothetical protein [Chryseolinea sp. H1M3-3]